MSVLVLVYYELRLVDVVQIEDSGDFSIGLLPSLEVSFGEGFGNAMKIFERDGDEYNAYLNVGTSYNVLSGRKIMCGHVGELTDDEEMEDEDEGYELLMLFEGLHAREKEKHPVTYETYILPATSAIIGLDDWAIAVVTGESALGILDPANPDIHVQGAATFLRKVVPTPSEIVLVGEGISTTRQNNIARPKTAANKCIN